MKTNQANKAYRAYVESVLAETARLTNQPYIRNTAHYKFDKRNSRQLMMDVKQQIHKLRTTLKNARHF